MSSFDWIFVENTFTFEANPEKRSKPCSILPWFSHVLLQHRLHGFELRKVLTHVRVQDHVDAEVAELAKLRLLHVRKDVAVVLLNQSEKQKKQ